MSILKHIPNVLTCFNLVLGCLGIVYCFTAGVEIPLYCIGFALVFDFLDGFTARLLKVSSAIGRELDSLADMVTFGVLPAMVMYRLLSLLTNGWVPYLAFAIAVFSALRLARFNIDENQKKEFIGVPTPANALFISSLVPLAQKYEVLNTVPMLIAITIVTSLWLVAPIRLISLKFESFKISDNGWRYCLIASSIITLAIFKLYGVPFIIIIYLMLSIVKNLSGK